MKFEHADDTFRCLFDARLNTTVCTEIAPGLEAAIAAAIKESPDIRIDFDLGETEYICSAFLRLCIFHCKRVGVSRFRVSHASPNVKEVFDIAGLSEMMSIR